MLYNRPGDYHTKISHTLLNFLAWLQGLGGSDYYQMTFTTQMFAPHSFGPNLGAGD